MEDKLKKESPSLLLGGRRHLDQNHTAQTSKRHSCACKNARHVSASGNVVYACVCLIVLLYFALSTHELRAILCTDLCTDLQVPKSHLNLLLELDLLVVFLNVESLIISDRRALLNCRATEETSENSHSSICSWPASGERGHQETRGRGTPADEWGDWARPHTKVGSGRSLVTE